MHFFLYTKGQDFSVMVKAKIKTFMGCPRGCSRSRPSLEENILVIGYTVVAWRSGYLVGFDQRSKSTSDPVSTELVTVSEFNCRCGTFISVCGQPPWSAQPGHPFVGRRNEYQPKSGDTLRLARKGRMVRVWQAGKLCDPLVTHGPYMSALAVVLPLIRR